MTTDPATVAAVAALAQGLHDCGWNDMCAGNKGSPCDSCVRAAGDQFHRLTPEARDKVLLGFALEELPDNKWVLKKISGEDYFYLSLYDDVGIADGGDGSTPLAAITATPRLAPGR